MRNLGGILLLLGILGFFYASGQLSELGSVSQGTSVAEAVASPAGRWEIVRYGCAGLGFFGLLLMMFPKGR